ncbi:hypothetical protein EBL84_15830 [Marichromatium sp. AB31]|nr:hypothetical protein EBL84_15830 [Marichromatium sp. AB31]
MRPRPRWRHARRRRRAPPPRPRGPARVCRIRRGGPVCSWMRTSSTADDADGPAPARAPTPLSPGARPRAGRRPGPRSRRAAPRRRADR